MALTAAEKQARYRARQNAEVERLRDLATGAPSSDAELAEARAEVARLKVELDRKHGRPPPLPNAAEEWQKANRAAKKAAAAKLYADDDEPTLHEKLQHAEKQLAAKTTRIKNLTAELRSTRDWYAGTHPAVMSLETFGKVSKLLIQDKSPEALEALQLLNAWRSTARKAR